ncbi:amiloride-sensitive sodium channel subunit alpha [Caerostris darwini]|uniref:Amiloride-sensitive sodium channel subunit alpha n=1 Tax=Caerostris darwini TaxID=1538125 RepID=A0AAV4R9C2_9ARAC|nr:amiloride-sensitive sodium channel subunit alpha [Caerostris darwini]
MAKWPSNAFFLKGMYKSAGEDIKTFRKSHAKVRISFSTLAMITYEQKPVFHESEIFSHLGGELGLWLGLSLIACIVASSAFAVGPLSLPERRSIHSCGTQLGGKQSKNSEALHEFLQQYSNLNSRRRNAYGHPQYIIKSHLFNGKTYKFNVESWLSFQYGNCFTLKAKESHILKQWKASSAGYAGGLELVIEMEPGEYVPISHTIGARILIHNANDTPDPETNGINIIPGYETDISLRQTIIKRLPAI